jgi:hypothetical protein
MSETAALDADLRYEVGDGIGLTFNMYERLAEICQCARKDPALTGALYRKPRAFVTKVGISAKEWMHFSTSASRKWTGE